MLRMRFWPMTARPMRAMSPCGSITSRGEWGRRVAVDVGGHSREPPAGSVLDPDAPAEEGGRGHPAVDPAAVVADLEPRALDRLDQVQVLPPVHLAQDDVPDPD